MKQLFIFLTIISLKVSAQETNTGKLGLVDVIQYAEDNSLESKVNKQGIVIQQKYYAEFMGSYAPTVTLYGNVPVYSKEFFPVTQPDGSIIFRSIQQNFSSIGLSISKDIFKNGGQLSLNTELSRFDEFRTKYRQYNATPVNINYSQNLSIFREYKWKKKIEDSKLDIAKKNLYNHQALLARDVAKIYFDIVVNNERERIARMTFSDIQAILAIEKKRIELGDAHTDKILQLQVLALELQGTIESANANRQSLLVNFQVYTKGIDTSQIKFEIPEELILPKYPLGDIESDILKNSYQLEELHRSVLEAQMELARIKSENITFNLSANFGLNKAQESFSKLYNNLNDQQRFSIGISLPLYDFGKRKRKLEIYKSIETTNTMQIDLQKTKMVAEITSMYLNLEDQRRGIQTAIQIDSVTMQLYNTTKLLFINNKVSLEQFVNTIQQMNTNGLNKLLGYRSYWDTFYLINTLLP